MNNQPERSLVRKLNEIKKQVGYLKKTGENKSQKYKYVEESAVIEAVRELMIERNLMIFPETPEITVTPSGTSSGGAQKNLTTVKMVFTLEDGDSGETRTVSMGGQGVDPGDKGIYKAETGANKYALLKLFQIPTGDDPELDDPDTGEKSRGGKQQQQRQQNNRQQQRQQKPNNDPAYPFGNIERMGMALNYSFPQLMDLINAARQKNGAPPINDLFQLEPNWIQPIEQILQQRLNKSGGQR
jgi:hypothetical protein